MDIQFKLVGYVIKNLVNYMTEIKKHLGSRIRLY